MRHLPTIIEQIIKEIPDGNKILVARLNSIHSSASFAPPEVQGYWWQVLAKTLTKNLGQPDTEWKMKISDIVENRNQ